MQENDGRVQPQEGGRAGAPAELGVPFAGKAELAPHYASELAAGADLRADLSAPLTLEPGQRAKIPTGIRLALPPGYEAQLRPRSGLAWKAGISMVNTPGTIDADYRGEVFLLLINHGQQSYTIQPHERIGQLVVTPVLRAHFHQVEQLESSKRGSDGFGSTGSH